ncbi:MAG: sigma-70 family RNA polymerase sigma factor [Polyangiaceae bacterium]
MVEKATFERIVSENASFVRRTLNQLGVPARSLADVEQEVYRGLYRGLPAFDPSLAAQPEVAIRSWLFGICERQAANHRRSEIRRGEVLVDVDDLDTAFDAPSSEESLIEAERKALLHRLLATLEPRRRAVVVAYELEGIPMSEVAAAVGIPVNTAWNRLRLAREDLRDAWNRLAAQRAPRAGVRTTPPRPWQGVGADDVASARRGGSTQISRSAGLPPLAVIFGSKAFAPDPTAPLWFNLPVLKVPLSAGSVAGASLTAAGVALGALAMHPSGAASAPPLKEPVVVAAATARSPRVDIAAPAADSSGPVQRDAEGEEDTPEEIGALGMNGALDVTGALDETNTPHETGMLARTAGLRGADPARPRHALGAGRSSARQATSADGSSQERSALPLSKKAASSVDVSLKEEVAEIQAAADALDGGDARLAIRLLAGHERSFPNGKMAADRELLRLRALLSEGRRNEARDCARRYLAAHPDAAVRARIEATVGAL